MVLYIYIYIYNRFHESILGKVLHPESTHPQLPAGLILAPSVGSQLSSKDDTNLLCAHLCKYLLTGFCLLGFLLLFSFLQVFTFVTSL